MARFNPIKGGTEPPAKPAKASRKKPKAAPPPPFRKSGSDHAKPPLPGGISSADFLAMLKDDPTPFPVGTAVVGAAIADAFGMRGLPNTVVIEPDPPEPVVIDLRKGEPSSAPVGASNGLDDLDPDTRQAIAMADAVRKFSHGMLPDASHEILACYLHKFMYHGSPDAKRVPADLHLEVMALCDGYGKLTDEELKAKELTWDWSHIRDSSPDATKAAAKHLRENSYKFDRFIRTAPPGEFGIRIERAEGPTPLEKFNAHTYIQAFEAEKLFQAADTALREWGKTAPQSGGYDKCDVRVDWPSGDHWEYRFDLKPDGTEGDGDNFLENLRHRIMFYAGKHKPDHFTDAEYAGIVGRNTPEQIAEMDAMIAALPFAQPPLQVVSDPPPQPAIVATPPNIVPIKPAPVLPKLPSAMEALARVRRETAFPHLRVVQSQAAANAPSPNAAKPAEEDPIFGPLIYSYTRSMALADGTLVDGMIGDLEEVSRQHFKHPIAMTSTVWELIESALNHPKVAQDIKGIWHDILWMAKKGIIEHISPSCVLFKVLICSNHARVQPVVHTLKCHCGPGDNAEPVITIMLQNED